MLWPVGRKAVLGVLCVFFVCSLFARAEGSRELTPDSTGSATGSNRFIGWLQHDDPSISFSFLKPSTYSGFSPDYRLYIHLEAGDTLYYGIRRIPTNVAAVQGDLTITIRYGSGAGTLVQQTTLYRDAASTNQAVLLPNQAGVIRKFSEVMAGPKLRGGSTPAGGYSPLRYINNTGGPKEFYVEFTQASSVAQKSWYDLWDFTVYNKTEKKGRLYSKAWSFQQGASLNLLSTAFKLYALIPSNYDPGKFYIKKIDLGGLRGFGFLFMCNDSGTRVAGDYLERRKSQPTNVAIFPKYKVFVNDPDSIFSPAATMPTFKATYLTFCNNDGVSGRMAFTMYCSQIGTVILALDLDGTPGYQEGTKDRIIEKQFYSPGYNSMAWDGKDGLGNPVPYGTHMKLYFKAVSSAVHFPMWDVEGNPTGFKVINVRPGQADYYQPLFWNDSNLSAAFTPRSNLAGISATAATGVHTWGKVNDDGNQVLVNTWSYGALYCDTQDVVFTYVCNADSSTDHLDNTIDVDDDDDGIPDVVEGYGVDPSAFTSGGLPRYLDASYVHPTRGAFRDDNNDGVNDIFDLDMDGIPNQNDRDADNDGILDAIEANCGTPPAYFHFDDGEIYGGKTVNVSGYSVYSQIGVTNYSRILGTPNSSSAELFDANDQIIVDMHDTIPQGENISVTWKKGKNKGGTSIIYVSAGLTPSSLVAIDTISTSSYSAYVTSGFKANSDIRYIKLVNKNIESAVDAITASYFKRVSSNGMPIMAQTYDNSGVSKFPLCDTDGDGQKDFLDFDSDNDGITDRVEAQSDFYPVTSLSGQDNDKDGIDNVFDIQCKPCGSTYGISVYPYNKDSIFLISDSIPDYLDWDSDNDGSPDWVEGFDDNLNGYVSDDLKTRGSNFETSNHYPQEYVNVMDDDYDGIPNWMEYITGSSPLMPAFLYAGSPYFYDANQDGLIDLYDPASGGVNSYLPDRNTDGNKDFRDINTATPLPVLLLNFNAILKNNEVQTSWITATEINNDYFTLERSRDGGNFDSLAAIRGAGNSEAILKYQWTDKRPLKGISYYRLKQTDFNGKYTYSRIVAVRNNTENYTDLQGGMSLYPNPGASAQIKLRLDRLPGQELSLEIYDMNAAMIFKGQKSLDGAGELNLGDLLPQKLLPGMYIIQAMSADGALYRERFMVR